MDIFKLNTQGVDKRGGSYEKYLMIIEKVNKPGVTETIIHPKAQTTGLKRKVFMAFNKAFNRSHCQ